MDNGDAGEIDTSAHKYSHFHLINIVFLIKHPDIPDIRCLILSMIVCVWVCVLVFILNFSTNVTIRINGRRTPI